MENIQTKREIYKKAYSELNEIFNSALSFEIERIPEHVIENMKNQRDTEYNWKYDYSKNLMDQDMMEETKALLVEVYARYLSSPEEKECWERYNNICTELIEEERIKKQEQNNIFENKLEIEEINSIENKEIKIMYAEKKDKTSDTKMISEKNEYKNVFLKIMDALRNMFKNNK